MKKLFSIICLFLAISSAYGQNFVPDPTLQYNIVQTVSNLVVGPTISGGFSTSVPVVTTLTNTGAQAFSFVPVPDKADTYYLLNAEGKYLNKVSTVTWDTWSVIFESTTATLSSEWVISGATATSIRLMNNSNSKYLASDKVVSGSGIYCDKAVDNPNGEFKLQVAIIDDKPVFTILEQNLVLEIEKELQPYPLDVVASGQNYNIDVTASTGFIVDKTSITPAQFTSGSGKVQVYIEASTANIGDTGKVVFSYSLAGVVHYLDTVLVTAVATYERLFIIHKGSGLVIGNNSTNPLFPSLTANISDYTQNFIKRPVHPGVNDSLFYIIQDGEYRLLKKTPTSGWDTEYGASDNGAIWKIVKLDNGNYSIANYANLGSTEGKMFLGSDAIIADSRLYADKKFGADATEWIIASVSEVSDPTSSKLSGVTLSAGLLKQVFNSDVTSYDVYAPADVSSITITGAAKTFVASIATNPVEITSTSPAVLTCVSGDASSTTNYNFNFVPLTFDKWAAEGETNVTKSIPTQWGWKCANATWAGANASTAGTVRYMDSPAGVYYLGGPLLLDTVAYTGRIMYTHWDGTIGLTGVYSYPVKLDGGVTYTFKGKYEWDSSNPDKVSTSTFTFGINTAADNTGTSFASYDFVADSTDMKHLHDAAFTFVPANSGVYYLTVANNAAIWGAVADLSISDGISALDNTLSQSLFATVAGEFVKVQGTNAGDRVKVYNVNGQLVKQLTADSNITTINLKSGVYIIKVNTNVLKVLK